MSLSPALKKKIINLNLKKTTQVTIAKKLKISQSSVSRILKKWNKEGRIDDEKRFRRKHSLDDKDISVVKKIIKKNPKTSLRKVATEVKAKTGKSTSHVTIKNLLNELNIFAYRPIKKPLLSKKNILRRIEETRKFLTMSKTQIKTIIFSDECKFNLYQSDGNVSVWRPLSTGLQLKNLTPTIKFGGGSIMAWGCFSYYGMGKLVWIDSNMNAVSYVNILADNLDVSADEMGLSDFIFQQDNDPKHTSKLAKYYFEEKEINLLSWPPQSPDLNPIETIWAYIKKKISNYRFKNLKELKDRVEKEWYSIPLEYCQKLALSFRKRSAAVFKANGGHIKY